MNPEDDDGTYTVREDESVPTIDDEEPRVNCYPDWSPATSIVLSGPCGGHTPLPNFPGRHFPSVEAAMDFYRAQGRRVYQDLSVPQRWILRVSK